MAALWWCKGLTGTPVLDTSSVIMRRTPSWEMIFGPTLLRTTMLCVVGAVVVAVVVLMMVGAQVLGSEGFGFVTGTGTVV